MVGYIKNEFKEVYGIRVTSKVIKCLYIDKGRDEEECYYKNVRYKLFEF